MPGRKRTTLAALEKIRSHQSDVGEYLFALLPDYVREQRFASSDAVAVAWHDAMTGVATVWQDLGDLIDKIEERCVRRSAALSVRESSAASSADR